MDTCTECGATSDPACGELFQRLLTLDYSLEEPWGPLHGVAVACYRLQHPASLPEGSHHFLLELLRSYVEGGADATRRLTERARRANSHRVQPRVRATAAPTPTNTPTGFAVTITDIAVGGSFPADGYSERVRSWAEATRAAWRG